MGQPGGLHLTHQPPLTQFRGWAAVTVSSDEAVEPRIGIQNAYQRSDVDADPLPGIGFLGRRGHVYTLHRIIDHQGDELLLAGDMAVQGARCDPELDGKRTHAGRLAVLLCQGQRDGNNAVLAERCH